MATYESRAKSHPTALGRTLFSIVAEKKSNLCISVDIQDPEAVLALLDSIPRRLARPPDSTPLTAHA